MLIIGDRMKKIEADQGFPYKLMKNKLFNREQYKEFLYIVTKNIPGISANEVIEMFKKLSNTGCSGAMFANSLVEQIYQDDETFKNRFGFSLLTKGKIDCNKLMVDIFSKLYGVMKVKFIEYERYSFSSINEATLTLLGKTYNTDSEAYIQLFNSGINADGKDSNGNFIFKSKVPKTTNHIGTCEEVAKEKFGLENIKTIDNIKNICKEKNIEVEFKDIEIYEKLTGLGTQNFNFWSNYYLNKNDLNYSIDSEAIIVGDFNSDYSAFIDHINNLVLEGYSISVASTPNSIAYMHTDKKMSWSKISSKETGHVMLFKYFDNNKDIVVSSYGEDYIIPKEYFNLLEYNKLKKREIEENKKRV